MAPLTEDQFHAAFLQSLARLCGIYGDGQVAVWLGVCRKQLKNIKGGSLPTADKIWNLLAYDASAHDEIDRKFGSRNVPHDAVCSSDPVAARLSRVLTAAIEAESPESHGGSVVTLKEIRAMDEDAMRAVHRTLAGWIDRLDNEREAPALRAVGR
jgi:hypothetical protein